MKKNNEPGCKIIEKTNELDKMPEFKRLDTQSRKKLLRAISCWHSDIIFTCRIEEEDYVKATTFEIAATGEIFAVNDDLVWKTSEDDVYEINPRDLPFYMGLRDDATVRIIPQKGLAHNGVPLEGIPQKKKSICYLKSGEELIQFYKYQKA